MATGSINGSRQAVPWIKRVRVQCTYYMHAYKHCSTSRDSNEAQYETVRSPPPARGQEGTKLEQAPRLCTPIKGPAGRTWNYKFKLMCKVNGSCIAPVGVSI